MTDGPLRLEPTKAEAAIAALELAELHDPESHGAPRRKTPALVLCELCGEPLELAAGARDLVCGCTRDVDPPRCETCGRWGRVDFDGERSCAVPLALQILAERYGLDGRRPRTLAETARRHGISRRKVRELEARVILALRKILG